MSEDRGRAIEIAIKALLMAAKIQGVHVGAICEGAVDSILQRSGYDQINLLAAATIQRLAYDVELRQ